MVGRGDSQIISGDYSSRQAFHGVELWLQSLPVGFKRSKSEDVLQYRE
jgi:hypothetical protein